MSTTKDREKSDCRLGQYYQNFHGSPGGYARQIFRKEANIDYVVSTTKYLELHNPELIGCSALHIAAGNNCLSDIEYLLSRGVDPMIKSQNGSTALHFAVKDNFKSIDDFHKVKSGYGSLLSAQVRSGNSENPTDSNGLSHFHIACMADHAEAIEFFINSGVSVDETINMDSPYFPGYTPLHLAARYSALQAMKLLLNYEANTQLKNAEEMTFLCKTLEIRFEIVQPLSKYSTDFRDIEEAANLKVMNFLVQNDGYTIDISGLTLFHLACFMGDLSIAEDLLQKISNINQALDMDAPHWPGYIALHFAAYCSIEIVKLLVINGANLLAKDVKGVTPLDMCIEKYDVEDVHAVLSLDASWKSVLMSDRKTRLLHLLQAMKDTNVFNNFFETRGKIVNTYVPSDAPAWQGFTPLHLAVLFYDYRTSNHGEGETKDLRSEHIIKKLVAKGANINAQDARRWSPIHLAFRQHIRDTKKKATRFLLEFHDKIADAIDEDNLSHLHIACELHRKESVEKILQTNVDVNIAIKGQINLLNVSMSVSSVGTTPLHCAASNDEIVNLLLARGANPLLKNAKNMTAIHLSAGCSQSYILSSAHLTDAIVDDVSHLNIAIQSGNAAAARKLLDSGANVNQALLRKSPWSRHSALHTPLDVAAKNLETEMIELLLRRGAEILVKEPGIPTENGSEALKPFVLSLNGDDNLFKRLEKEIGLTMLHVACSRKDVDLTKALLASGADVNARINAKSRLWPGYTALHCAADDDSPDQKIDEVVRLLLDNGADVYRQTGFAQEETALHMIYDRIPHCSHNNYSCMKMILRAHKDFTVNPTRVDGFSHFHVACDLGDVISVEQFLKHGVGVNQRTTFFKPTDVYSDQDGYTPLLLVASRANDKDPMTQLTLIDLLLNYGADVDAEDVNGNTSLHLMAKLIHKREGDLLRLIKSKANVDSRNIRDETPLEVLMRPGEAITIGKINCFLKFGCNFNVFNCTTDKGLIAIALTLLPHEDQMYLIRNSMINFPRLMQVEEAGCTVIHNIVSNTNELVNNKRISVAQYIALIDELGDHDVDAQDKLGRAPLHLAVLFRNIEAISGLLMVGADVNITDASGKTAFSYLFQPCTRCSETRRRLENHNQWDHFDIFSIFVMHIKKLLLCELIVNQTNENLLLEVFEKFSAKDMTVSQYFEGQINEIRGLKTAKVKLTLGRFLSEIDAVVAYSTITQADRNTFNHVFKNELNNLRKKNSNVASILLLQYRKAVKRVKLNESAKSALNILSKWPMPDLCSTAILKLLTNSDLNSMIEATA